MRGHCRLIRSVMLLWMVSSSALAQDQDLAKGYLRFVNATGYEKNLSIWVDGININPTGYSSGMATGSIGLDSKDYQIEFRHETLGEKKFSVTLKPGLIAALIALPLVEEEKKPKPGQTSTVVEKPKVALTYHVLESTPFKSGSAPTLTLLQSTPMKVMELDVGGRAMSLQPLKPESVSLAGMGDFPQISLGGKRLTMLNMGDPVDSVVVLFITDKGLLQTVSFSN